MTGVRIRFTPNGVPTAGRIRFQARHDKDTRPIVSGRDILNGNPEWVEVPVEGADIEVRPQDAGWHYVVRAQADGGPALSTTVLIPQNGPVNFEDLVRYDPKAGMAYEPDPDWWAHLNSIENGIEGVQADLHTARDLAVTSANSAYTSAATAVSARDVTTAARDQTLAAGLVVDTSNGIRVTAGGVVTYYDSELRDVTADVMWDCERALLRRVNNTCSLWVWNAVRPNNGSYTFLSLPAAYRPPYRNTRVIVWAPNEAGSAGGTTITIRRSPSDVTSATGLPLGSDWMATLIEWKTAEPVPGIEVPRPGAPF